MAWLNLLGDIRQLPFLGIYVIMFFDILKTFLKFVIVFLVFLVAFALGFHTLLLTRVDVSSGVLVACENEGLSKFGISVGTVQDLWLFRAENHRNDAWRV